MTDAIIDPEAAASHELARAVKTDFRHMTAENLADVLKQHQEWLDSRGARGAQAILTRTDLRGHGLSGSCLTLAVMTGGNFRNVDFSGAELSMCDFSGADLRGANLSGADLRGAQLQRTHLDDADLHTARLGPLLNVGESHRDFRTDLSHAKLVRADLTGADLTQVNLDSVDFSGAILNGADLSGAQTEHAILGGASMNGTKLV